MTSVRTLLAAILLVSATGGAMAIPHALPPAEPPSALEFISLPPVLFDFDAHTLDQTSAERLEEIALFLRRQSRISRIVLSGHADIIAGEEYNENLAWRRAETVRNQLLELGVPPRLLHITARGQSDPVDHNENSAGRARNRRVEIYVIVR
jgi:OOP family OmpA-OmpF porin